MKIIQPGFEILVGKTGSEILKSIERAGRTCYKSEDEITGVSSERFVEMLIKRGHHSVLEHECISVKFICDRGVSHELVRHRLAAFSQESTRYCNYSKEKFGKQITFIDPFFWPHNSKGIKQGLRATWYHHMNAIEKSYMAMIALGATPQQARSILPNSLKTEIVITANIREWRHIFSLRTSKAAHPQMRQIMCPLLKQVRLWYPVIFDDVGIALDVSEFQWNKDD